VPDRRLCATLLLVAFATVPAAAEPRPLPPGYHPVLALAVSPDQKRLAAARGDQVLLFDLTSPERPLAATLATPGEPVYSLAWSPDGKWLAAGGHREVRVWDPASPTPRMHLTELTGRVTALAFTPDSTVLLAGDGDAASDGTARQWSVPDGKPLHTWTAHGDSVLSLKPLDGNRLLSAGGDKVIKLWDRADGKLLGQFDGHASQVTALALSPDGTRLASAGADREARVWDLKTREKTEAIPAHPAGVSGLVWLDNEKLLTACDDGVVRVAAAGKERRFERSFGPVPGGLSCIVLTADGKTLFGGSNDGDVFAWTVASGAIEKKLPVPPETGGPAADTPTFVNDVLPVLSKAGCNAGACHAKPAGQSGFKLSVFAYDPRADYRAITREIRGRRVSPAAPEESLLLRKPTMAVEHGGGKRLRKSSDAYGTLVRWITAGMPYAHPGTPALAGVEVQPREQRAQKTSANPLRVVARFSDGSTRDVTALADFSSTDKTVATVDEAGVVKVGDTPGEAVIVARYMGQVDVSRVTVPADKLLPDAFYASLPANNFIDPLLYGRLKSLGLSPSDACTDAEFLRRASLDAMGALPTADEARGFLADTDPQKRSKLIDRLLDDPRYADHWADKWADLLRPNPFRAGVKSVYVLDQWLRESFRQNKPYDQFVREILLARGSTHRDGPVVVFRDKREPPDIGAFVAQIFLGVRIECARCHHHPNEKWSQEDFYQLAAYFAPLKRKGQGISAPISGEAEYVWFAPGGTVKHPVTDAVMNPKAPDGPAAPPDGQRDPREALAAWMTGRDNPYFARAAVNRVWAELMGRGIVHPVDDFRTSNPPTNGPLLDALAKDFVDHGYDLKHLVRTVMRSRAYQLSSVPNETNVGDTKNFSRHYRRRASAEVLLDAVSDVTGVREPLQGSPPDARAAAAWNYRIDSDFLDAFSRPNPSADPPCERDAGGSVVQALHLMNSNRLMVKLSSDTGRSAALAKSPRTPREIVDELYLAAYARYPSPDEAAVAAAAFAQKDATRQSATEDILWALVNSAEFVFNH
jgi:WD40 repeat protein